MSQVLGLEAGSTGVTSIDTTWTAPQGGPLSPPFIAGLLPGPWSAGHMGLPVKVLEGPSESLSTAGAASSSLSSSDDLSGSPH